MGRGSTWSRQLPWLTELGEVYTYDAPWHRGRDVADPHPVSTERFVDDLADAVAALGRPVTLIGHSMGGLHSWCLAAARPDLVTALVVEDMAPDFRGRTTGPWEPWLHALPVEFGSERAGLRRVRAGRRTVLPRGVRPHRRPGGDCTADTERWIEIAAEWGTRDYWQQWHAVRAPTLLDRGGQLRHAARPDGPDARDRRTGRRICTCRAPVTSSTTTRRGNTATRSRRS